MLKSPMWLVVAIRQEVIGIDKMSECMVSRYMGGWMDEWTDGWEGKMNGLGNEWEKWASRWIKR